MSIESEAPIDGQMFFWTDVPEARVPHFDTREFGSSFVSNIPSDDGGRLTLAVTTKSGAWGDVFILMNDNVFDEDHVNFGELRGIRLRGGIGGGMNPFVTEGFMSILDGFALRNQDHQSKTEDEEYEEKDGFTYYYHYPEEKEERVRKPRDKINSNSTIAVERFKKGETRLTVGSIQDDDGEPNFIDIDVLRNGDIRLRMRSIHERLHGKTLEIMGEMLFRSWENGGANPEINIILTDLTKRIAKARDLRTIKKS